MIYLVVFLPLIGFLYCAFLGNRQNAIYSQIFTSLSLIISCIFSWILFFQFFQNKNVKNLFLLNWIDSGDFNVDWSFRIDSLTTTMLIVVTTVSACVHIYSIGYMNKDNSKQRFMGYLSLFTFFMLMLVTSDNLLQMFFGWEGVGLASYLLIGFWHHKESANKAAIKAFIVNRIGDFGFAIGIIGIFFIFGSTNFDIIFSKAPIYQNNIINILGLNFNTIDLLCFMLFIGAMGKSAQLGLHTWLPDAMEGPTPVSALIHAATMVTAGVFMVCRMSPLFDYAAFTNIFIICIGATTAIFAASIAITQNDIKKVIAYSTCSQLGYMFFSAGLGSYNASMFHLMTHGFFKALLFLCAGSVIHSLHHEQDMRKMGGIFNKMPVTGTFMWIGSLSIIGFPLFSGYYSKESILKSAYFFDSNIGSFAYTIGIITALLTAFYSWRLLLMTFHGKSNLDKNILSNLKESSYIMNLPLLLLAFGSLFAGYLFVEYFLGYYQESFWNGSIILHQHKEHYMPFLQTLIIKLSVSLGILLATIIYFYKKNLSNYLAKKFKFLYLMSINKWYIDEIYDFILVKPYFIFSKILWERGDQKFIDYYGPNGIAKIVNTFSKLFSKFQSGYLYHYAFSMIGGLVIILSWFIYS